jgi:hypothetical protein
LDLPEQVIRVGAEESRDSLLAQLEAAHATRVLLRVTREAVIPRAIEDFQALKSLARRRRLQLRIVSPVASVVGLAKIYDIEAEFDATVGKTDALAPPPPPPIAARPPPPLTPLASPGIPPAPPASFPGSASAPAAPPSENDWLFGGLDVETLESDFAAERGRSAAPPPDLRPSGAGESSAPGPSAPAATPAPEPPYQEPPAPIAPPVPAPPEPPPTPAPATPPPGGFTTHQPGTLNAARDPLQDSQFLPDWLRPTAEPAPPAPPPPAATPPPPTVAVPPLVATPPPAPAPLFAHGAPAKPGPRWVVPCPHCGEPMDLELLIQHADYQD